jgi:hypothetical protein
MKIKNINNYDQNKRFSYVLNNVNTLSKILIVFVIE